MQNRKRRYLGMTLTQLIVVACLGFTALGVMGIAGKMFLGNPMNFNIMPGQPTQQTQVNSTPLPTWTESPTITFTPILPKPTFTATTYESLIPEGWKQQKYKNIEFWAPADFESHPSSGDLIELASKKTGKDGIPANVSLTNEVGIKTDLDTFVKDGIDQFTREVTYLERKDFGIGIYEAKRLKLEVIVSNTPMESVVYFIKVDDTVWIITCFSHLEDFHDWLPIFDKIAHTFRITP
jgi:hypothetical protein